MVVFIAIELDNELKNRICECIRTGVRPLCRGGRWVDSRNYHLTLKYIGRVGKQQIDELYRLLDQAVGRFRSFTLTTDSIGSFGKLRDGRARVLWLGTKGDGAVLQNLREYIENKTVELGFKTDKRFSPHITIARDVRLTRQLDGIKAMRPTSFAVNSVSLVESRLERGKRVYIPLSVHKLGR